MGRLLPSISMGCVVDEKSPAMFCGAFGSVVSANYPRRMES